MAVFAQPERASHQQETRLRSISLRSGIGFERLEKAIKLINPVDGEAFPKFFTRVVEACVGLQGGNKALDTVLAIIERKEINQNYRESLFLSLTDLFLAMRDNEVLSNIKGIILNAPAEFFNAGLGLAPSALAEYINNLEHYTKSMGEVTKALDAFRMIVAEYEPYVVTGLLDALDDLRDGLKGRSKERTYEERKADIMREIRSSVPGDTPHAAIDAAAAMRAESEMHNAAEFIYDDAALRKIFEKINGMLGKTLPEAEGRMTPQEVTHVLRIFRTFDAKLTSPRLVLRAIFEMADALAPLLDAPLLNEEDRSERLARLETVCDNINPDHYGLAVSNIADAMLTYPATAGWLVISLSKVSQLSIQQVRRAIESNLQGIKRQI